MDAAITALISLTCGMLGAILSAVSVARAKRKDQEAEGTLKGQMASDIGYIKAGVDDLKADNKEIHKEIQDDTVRIARCEESVRSAHKRIDKLEGDTK